MKIMLLAVMCSAAMSGGCSLEEEQETEERGVAEVQTQSVYTLTVHVVSSGERMAGGDVSSSPAGIWCATDNSGTCSAVFAAGTTINLLANEWPGNVLDRWIGCPNESGLSCSVTMNSNITLTAAFFCPPRRICAI